MDFKPIKNYVLVDPYIKPNQTSGGVYLPDNYEEQTYTGTVVSVGPGKKDEKNKFHKTTIGENQKIVYGSMSKEEIELGNKKYHLIKEESIIGVVK